MPKHLLIVESPAKAKTIEKYLGKDFTVKSSYGHIRDLIKDSKDKKAIEINNNYKSNYQVSQDKKKVVSDLKQSMKQVDEVWLATDKDREGEAIAWHLAHVLKLDLSTTKRIVFREITKPALQSAIQNPGKVDIDLVNAQQARRVLDRLVGFELSELLWRKVRGKLSAGRVQSVTVKLVVEREREINAFQAQRYFQVKAVFLINEKVEMKANLNHNFDSKSLAYAFLEQCKDALFKVSDISVKPAFRKPSAPFITSTLQQEASRKLGFSVSRTMSVAQKLYDAGHVTYMRTDSTALSDLAMNAIASAIEQNYGKKYLNPKQYSKVNNNAQEAHEAIRPTYIENESVSMGTDEKRLYELIWKRTIASQMADAKLQKTNIDISISKVQSSLFQAKGQVLEFDGFLKVYNESNDNEEDEKDDDKILPPLNLGQELDMKKIMGLERLTKSKARYTEASLVKKLEELGIGRPSTYAPTISRIMDPKRGYVVRQTREGKETDYEMMILEGNEIKESTKKEVNGYEKNKLFATDLGIQVTDFLDNHFNDIMQYSFTAGIEDQLDVVANGEKAWVNLLDEVYLPFHKSIESALEKAERVTGEKILGKDPKSGHTVLVRIGRYGPIAQIGTTEELGDAKPQYANLKDHQSIETIELKEALELFVVPKSFEPYEGKEINLGEGRYGPYVKYGTTFISLPKGMDLKDVNRDICIELIQKKLKEDAPFGTYKDQGITKGAGRFGPFVKWNGMFVSITKGSGFQLETITEAQAIILIEDKLNKEANKFIHNWEKEGISVQNGRYGPYVKVANDKKNYKLLNDAGEKMNMEEAKTVTLEHVIKVIEQQGAVIKNKK